LKICYILAFLTGFIWLLGNIARHNAFYEVPIIVAKARSGLMLLIFSKLSRVSQYTVKNQEVGKIINMMSNDFNIIEQKGPWLFFSLVSPILIIGTIVILLFRLGWPGLICPFVSVILLPLQFWVSNVNGKIMKDINTNQDKRIKITTEIIEGIKFIKLYGWELAFREIIRKIRNMEISQYVFWSFGKSIERSIAKCTTFWSGLVCFLVMYFTEQGEPLTVANIFSTLEILNTLKLSMLYLGISGGFYFELQVIFERYANILNIKEERMIKVPKEDI
jgi:ATP-binding cassette subfamily C (CFTR/MRP) protein 4